MPPKSSHDHAILLLTGAQLFQLRPYCNTHLQKDEIELQVQEVLSSGVIQQSHSPFSSLVLLVKTSQEKDGEWRLCVDYRRLNAYTVKSKFPIPIFIESSGYRQIHIKEGDEYKTAFQTHSGHYEYKVMSFGLIGAPTTFESFMNSVLAPLLWKCVVVFIDDILVYSKDYRHHLVHLK